MKRLKKLTTNKKPLINTITYTLWSFFTFILVITIVLMALSGDEETEYVIPMIAGAALYKGWEVLDRIFGRPRNRL